MNQIIINGKSFNVSGNDISIVNNRVIVDGKEITSELSGVVEIRFIGDNLCKLKAQNVTVEGSVNGPVDCHNITCKDVKGNISAHNVTCKNVIGDVKAKNVGF